MDIKIMVAAHKPYKMPEDTTLYLPVFVGSALRPKPDDSYTADNTGDNISAKNTTFNELTALYWGWKNLDCDYIGLDHYRRYMTLHKSKNIVDVLTSQQLKKLFQTTDIILPTKRHYYIETNYSHYIHVHHVEPLELTREIISKKYPRYLASFDKVLKRRSAHMFNMYIMKKSLNDKYCKWLFDILFTLEKQVDVSGYDEYERRVFGFVSELLLDVWLDANDLSYVEVQKSNLENEHWFRKIFNFLYRKFFRGHRENVR
ncbi:DUF4422 domain-containing protein [Lactiplantibacillus pingfangensis]|uniref:DUF4422 domain-containing protein n=1 Tax=Lactiplantibacillus pingfangensis TaxID=2559915 RepID=UPI0010F52EE1|nr:DUF4422 domain-containing protein [Lactiplantibacillus pingfangensis]